MVHVSYRAIKDFFFSQYFKAARKGIKKLTDCALMENWFLKNSPVEVTLHKDFSKHAQDPVANTILDQYHYTTKAALLSTGDGDCLFNAFSTYLVGDETKSVELRFRCCVEMIVNKKKLLRHRLYHNMELISPDYDEDCLKCATPGSFSSVFRLVALSNLLNIPVESIYPTVNGCKSLYFRTLNNVFKPPFSDPEKGKITIMWTSTFLPEKNTFAIRQTRKKEWCPNHFVPLVDEKRFCRVNNPSPVVAETLTSVVPESKYASPNRFEHLTTEDVDQLNQLAEPVTDIYRNSADDCGKTLLANKKTPAPDTKKQNKKVQSSVIAKNHADEDRTINEIPARKESAALDTKNQIKKVPSNDSSMTPIIESTSDNELSSLVTVDVNEEMYYSPITLRTEVPDLSTIQEEESFVEEVSCIDQSIYHEVSKSGEDASAPADGHEMMQKEVSETELSENKTPCKDKTPHKDRFMELEDTLLTLRGPYAKLSEIPQGRKEHTYFILDNSPNIAKRAQNIKSEFWDDCGAWNRAASPKSLYIEKDGRLISIVKRDGQYCIEKWSHKKRIFVPVEPQPADSDILEVHRLYQTLKASSSGPLQYKRRITWLENVPESMPGLAADIAIVEYIGNFPQRQQHGGVKYPDRNVVYIKTKESVKQKLQENLKHLPPKAVEKKSNLETGNDMEKQRNLRQLKNMKAALEKAERSSSSYMNNVADHIVCVENMTQNHDFVRAVQHMKGFTPSVILYTDNNQSKGVLKLYVHRRAQ